MSKKAFRTVLLAVFGVLAVLSAAGLGLKSEAAAGKRPVVVPVWGAKIFDYGNLSGMGEDHIYKTGDPNVRVIVQKSTTGGIVTRTAADFFIYENVPLQEWAQFQNVALSDYTLADDAGPLGWCGFPPGFDAGGSPACLEGFINAQHPMPGYDHLMFHFAIDADIEDTVLFPPGQPVSWTGGLSAVIYFWNWRDALTAESEDKYESVTMRLTDLCTLYPKGYWITRVDDSTWEIWIEQAGFSVEQFYQWAEPGIGRNGKPTTIFTSYKPLTGKTTLSYKIRLCKNPT